MGSGIKKMLGYLNNKMFPSPMFQNIEYFQNIRSKTGLKVTRDKGSVLGFFNHPVYSKTFWVPELRGEKPETISVLP